MTQSASHCAGDLLDPSNCKFDTSSSNISINMTASSTLVKDILVNGDQCITYNTIERASQIDITSRVIKSMNSLAAGDSKSIGTSIAGDINCINRVVTLDSKSVETSIAAGDCRSIHTIDVQLGPEIANLSSLDLSEWPDLPTEGALNISELYLDYNNFTSINQNYLERLRSLRKLSIIGNELSALPDEMSKLGCLEELYLNENALLSLPSSLTLLQELRVLDLTGNNLSQLPPDIGHLAKMEKLRIEENKLETLPMSFAMLTELQVLELNGNALHNITMNFGCLKKLKILNLSSNDLWAFPPNFHLLPSLKVLDISDNHFSELPATFASCQTLEKLFCDCNGIHFLPDWVSEMPEIREMNFERNDVAAEPFTQLLGKSSRKLRKLQMATNKIQVLPSSFGELSELEYLHLGSALQEVDRRVSGQYGNGNFIRRLPDSFIRLQNLKICRLDENELRELPDQFGLLVTLEDVNLEVNNLDRLPDSFCNLHRLKTLSVGYNRIDLLPSAFGDLVSLERLRLDNNQLHELPESFSKLKNLKDLNLNDNHLEDVPSCIPDLASLEEVKLFRNKFPYKKLKDVHPPNAPMPRPWYAPRDPAQKNNWRGRPRVDVPEELQKVLRHTATYFGDDKEVNREEENSDWWNEEVGPHGLKRYQVYGRPDLNSDSKDVPVDWDEIRRDYLEHLEQQRKDRDEVSSRMGENQATITASRDPSVGMNDGQMSTQSSKEDHTRSTSSQPEESDDLSMYSDTDSEWGTCDNQPCPITADREDEDWDCELATTEPSRDTVDHTFVPSTNHVVPIKTQVHVYQCVEALPGQFDDADED